MSVRICGLLVLSGCGLLGGTPAIHFPADCEILDVTDVEEPSEGAWGMAPIADRLDAIVGVFDIEALPVRDEDTWGPFAGSLSLVQQGTIVAEDRALPDGPLEGDPDRCASRYVVPMSTTLELEGGELALTVSMELTVSDARPMIDGAVYDGWGGYPSWPAEVVTGSLDVRHRGVVEPEEVTLSVSFVDGVTPSGSVDFSGYDEEYDAQVEWSFLQF